ncbi:MAG: MBL fold metallo-hydrolase [Chloroflexi bacterium]|nr:MBL fold metallo-hydrolase [Chloroflexota bacterium]
MCMIGRKRPFYSPDYKQSIHFQVQLFPMKPICIELPTEFHVGSVNSYLFTEPVPILVDCGVDTPASWDALLAGLAENGLTPSDIRRIVITHPHIDHFGQAAKINAVSGAPVWVADLGKSWLIQPGTLFRLRADYYRDSFLQQTGIPSEMGDLILAYFAGLADIVTPVPANVIKTFQVGDWLEMGGAKWQVLHMPGHASHQTCFYQPESRQFLSGDMLLSQTPTPIVERPFANKSRQLALPTFMESLARCETLDIDTVYPGHGEPFQNHRQLIQQQRSRIYRRKKEALALIEQNCQTAFTIMNQMYAHLPSTFRLAGLWMLIGYLDLLQAEDKIVVKTVDGVWNYYVN